MAPPPPIIIDAQAVSGITGSISLACWIIVFAPQIYENFRRKSSEGLSLLFIILWLAGDVFNVLGSVLQGLLPTMIILAVYYTLADIVLLWQCLIYGHGEKADYRHLSPANPLNEDVLETALSREDRTNTIFSDDEDLEGGTSDTTNTGNESKISDTMSIFFKTLMVSLVIFAGLAGWYISYVKDAHRGKKHHSGKHKHDPQHLVYDPLAQFFGWLCAVFYLGSRVPQILLNFQRKSCEGISFMFFLFACLGNLTYVISILAIDTSWYYLWVNSSWLAGSLGTLALDFTIFVQFFLYSENEDAKYDEDQRLLNDSQNSYGASQ